MFDQKRRDHIVINITTDRTLVVSTRGRFAPKWEQDSSREKNEYLSLKHFSNLFSIKSDRSLLV